jgi:hypothetical protein
VTVLELLQGARVELARLGWIGPAAEANPFVHDARQLRVLEALCRVLEHEPDPEDRLLLGAWDQLERIACPLYWQESRFWESLRGLDPSSFTLEHWKRAQAFALAGPSVSILDWLSASDRTALEVLGAFNKAINRLKGEQRNG